MRHIFNLQDFFSKFFRGIGGLALILMMLLTVGDVAGRFFKHPLFGSVELVGFLAVIAAAAALPHTYRANGHVGVEIFVRLLPPRARLWVEMGTRGLTLVLFGVIAWQMFLYAGHLKETGEVSMNLEIPLHYIVFLLASGLGVYCVTILQMMGATLKQIKEF